MEKGTTTPPGTSSQRFVLWNELSEPGYYVTQEGSGVRVHATALREGHSPDIILDTNRDTRLLKISDNPNLSSMKAATLAAQAGITPCFGERVAVTA